MTCLSFGKQTDTSSTSLLLIESKVSNRHQFHIARQVTFVCDGGFRSNRFWAGQIRLTKKRQEKNWSATRATILFHIFVKKTLSVTNTSHFSYELKKNLSYKPRWLFYTYRRLSYTGFKETLFTEYIDFFESVMSYRIIFCRFKSQQNLNRVFVLQKRSLRVVWGMEGADSSCIERLVVGDVLTLPSTVLQWK